MERPVILRVARGSETPALGGEAVCARLRITYASEAGESGMGVTVYYPAKGKPKGGFILIVNRSRTIIDEAETQPVEFRATGEPRHSGSIGYHVRAGAHDLLREDWRHYLDFADLHLRPAK